MGVVILGTSVFVTSLWMILFFLSSKRTFQIPGAVAYLTKRLGKEKGRQYIEQSNMWMREICMIIASGVGYHIGALDSIMAVMGANAIGNLPITVGGSGLAEFGIVAYLNNLNPFDLGAVERTIEWNAVIAWRIAKTRSRLSG